MNFHDLTMRFGHAWYTVDVHNIRTAHLLPFSYFFIKSLFVKYFNTRNWSQIKVMWHFSQSEMYIERRFPSETCVLETSCWIKLNYEILKQGQCLPLSWKCVSTSSSLLLSYKLKTNKCTSFTENKRVDLKEEK